MGAFNVQDLANTAWAFATAGQADAVLLLAVARVTEQRLGKFDAQSIANTVWAFTRVQQSDAALFVVLASSM